MSKSKSTLEADLAKEAMIAKFIALYQTIPPHQRQVFLRLVEVIVDAPDEKSRREAMEFAQTQLRQIRKRRGEV